MNFDGKILDWGEVEISAIKNIVCGLNSQQWAMNSNAQVNVARNRPVNALFVLTDRLKLTSSQVLDDMQNGRVNVCSGAGWPLLGGRTMELIINQISSFYPHCSPLRVQYAQLPQGNVIQGHIDHGILVHIHRLHVPIVTHPDVNFQVDGERFTLEEGHLYELNNTKRHSVRNESSLDRVHLLVDMLPNDEAEVLYHEDIGNMSNGKIFDEFFDLA